MYTNILVPLDGSTFAVTALPHASGLAAKFGCKVTLVNVFETPHIYQSIEEAGEVLDDIWRFGSVAHRIINHAVIPVVLIRPKAAE